MKLEIKADKKKMMVECKCSDYDDVIRVIMSMLVFLGFSVQGVFEDIARVVDDGDM